MGSFKETGEGKKVAVHARCIKVPEDIKRKKLYEHMRCSILYAESLIKVHLIKSAHLWHQVTPYRRPVQSNSNECKKICCIYVVLDKTMNTTSELLILMQDN